MFHPGDLVSVKTLHSGNFQGLILAVRNGLTGEEYLWRDFPLTLLPGLALVLFGTELEDFDRPLSMNYSSMARRYVHLVPNTHMQVLDQQTSIICSELAKVVALLSIKPERDIVWDGREFGPEDSGVVYGASKGRNPFHTRWELPKTFDLEWAMPLNLGFLFGDKKTGRWFSPACTPVDTQKFEVGKIYVVDMLANRLDSRNLGMLPTNGVKRITASLTATKMSTQRTTFLVHGTVVQCLDPSNRVFCLVDGGLGKREENKVVLSRLRLKPFEHAWFDKGDKISVSKEVNFRKRNLKGLQGKVLLPTDADGDVGVEFKVDLGAGTLDGIGADGRCLFIPAASLEKISK